MMNNKVYATILSIPPILRLPDMFVKRAVNFWLRSDVIFNFLYKSDIEEVNRVWKVFTEQPLQISKYNYELKKLKSNSTSLHDNKNISTKFQQKEKETAKDGQESNQIEITGMLNLIDVYTILQEKHPEFTDEELKHEMVTLYLAGVNTVAYTLSTSLLALAQHPRIQEALYEEILTSVGLHEEITLQDLTRMPYLDMFFKEVMRWATLVPMVERKTSADLELSCCTIPAGNTVVACLFGTLMDPKYFSDPTKFDPERFSMENSSSKEFPALPFCAGPRNCIGKNYAHMFVKTMVVDVVRHYKLTTSQDMHTMRRKWHITVEGVEGYRLNLQHRTAA